MQRWNYHLDGLNERVIIMGERTKTAQAMYTQRYMMDKHVIRVVVPKDKAVEYKKMAEEEGYKSLNQFIIDCIENRKR